MNDILPFDKKGEAIKAKPKLKKGPSHENVPSTKLDEKYLNSEYLTP